MYIASHLLIGSLVSHDSWKRGWILTWNTCYKVSLNPRDSLCFVSEKKSIETSHKQIEIYTASLKKVSHYKTFENVQVSVSSSCYLRRNREEVIWKWGTSAIAWTNDILSLKVMLFLWQWECQMWIVVRLNDSIGHMLWHVIRHWLMYYSGQDGFQVSVA